jgi:hypothetical protein
MVGQLEDSQETFNTLAAAKLETKPDSGVFETGSHVHMWVLGATDQLFHGVEKGMALTIRVRCRTSECRCPSPKV